MSVDRGWVPGAPSSGLQAYRVSRTTAADEVTSTLRQMILTGVLRPGQTLPQPQLAAELGVSRTPLREAFARLAGEGLLRMDPHKGALVAHVTRDDFVELYQLRQVVEAFLVRDVATRCTPAQAAALRDLAAACAESADDSEWVTRNRAFHNAVYAISHMTQTTEVVTSLASRADIYVRIFAGTGSSRDTANADHYALVDALAAQDGDAAAAHTVAHLQNTLDRTLGDLDA